MDFLQECLNYIEQLSKEDAMIFIQDLKEKEKEDENIINDFIFFLPKE